MAVLHAGMGGVAEALHNEVPLIVLPMSLDQFDITARVEHSGAGVRLDRNTLTNDSVHKAISVVSSPAYKKAAEKLHKIFVHAGGVERAAELVEFYGEVGYDHLVPAYLKHVLISAVMVVFVLAVFKCCAFGRCCLKTKTD